MTTRNYYTQTEIENWAWRVGGVSVTPSARLLLLALAQVSDNSGRANISIDIVNRLTGLNSGQKSKARTELENVGAIHHVRSGFVQLAIDTVASNSAAVKRESKKVDMHEDLFDKFWAVYPRKEKKRDAKLAFVRSKAYENIDKIIADIEARLERFPSWIPNAENKTFIPHATTYLTGQRWEDDWDKSKGLDPKLVEMVLASGDLEAIKKFGLEDEKKRRDKVEFDRMMRLYS